MHTPNAELGNEDVPNISEYQKQYTYICDNLSKDTEQYCKEQGFLVGKCTPIQFQYANIKVSDDDYDNIAINIGVYDNTNPSNDTDIYFDFDLENVMEIGYGLTTKSWTGGTETTDQFFYNERAIKQDDLDLITDIYNLLITYNSKANTLVKQVVFDTEEAYGGINI